MGNNIKRYKLKVKEELKKLKKFNKSMDNILNNDPKNKNFTISKKNSIKDESGRQFKLIYTDFEKNRKRH